MPISALQAEAARLFSLGVEEVTLVLFVSTPVTLRGGFVGGPPRVDPGRR
jgi:hypothetical protein